MASVDITDIRMALGISQPHGEVLFLLLDRKVVPTSDLIEAGVQYPRKDIQALRGKLGGFMPPIEILSHRKLGYWIDPEDKARLVRICRRTSDDEVE